MSNMQPMNNFFEDWNIDPMLSSGQQLYASGATVSGPVNAQRPDACTPLAVQSSQNTETSPINDLHGGNPDLDVDALAQDINTFNNHVCYTCFTSYKRLGDPTRHSREKHGSSSSKYLCPVEKCPKGIKGNGFDRMHRLVEHLKRGKHNMNGTDAVHLAHKHNMAKPKPKGDTEQHAGKQ